MNLQRALALAAALALTPPRALGDDTDIFLVNMSTYYGRIVVGDGRVDLHAEIKPERFQE